MKAELGRAVQLGEAHASQLSRAAESDKQRQLESVRRENSELKWRMESDQLNIGSLESRLAGLERQLSRMQTENADLANRLTSAAESIKRSVTEHPRVVPAPVLSQPGSEFGGDTDLLRLQLQRLEAEVHQLRGGSLSCSGFASPAKRTQSTQPTPPQPPQLPPPLRLASGVARDAEHRAVLGAAEAALRRLEEPREVAPTDDAEWAAAAAAMAVHSGPVSAGGYVLEERLPSNIGARVLLLQKKGGGSAGAVTGAAPVVSKAQSRRPDEFLLLCSPRKADVPISLTPPPPLLSPTPPPQSAPQRPHSSLQSSNPEDRLISERVRAFLARMPALGGAQRRRQRWLSDAEDNTATASATASQERENWEAQNATLASDNRNNNPFDDENEDDDEEGDETADEFADGYRRPPVRGLLDRLRAQAALRHRQELRRLDQSGGQRSAAPLPSSVPSEVAVVSAAEGAAEAAASKSALEQVRLRYRESSAEALYGGDSRVLPTKKPSAVGISVAEPWPVASTTKAPSPVVPRLDLAFTTEQQSDTLELTQSARRYADQLVAKYLNQTETPIY